MVKTIARFLNLKFLKFKVTLMVDLLSVGPGCKWHVFFLRVLGAAVGMWRKGAGPFQLSKDTDATGSHNWPKLGPICEWPKLASGYDSRFIAISFFQGRPHCSARKRFCILLRAHRNVDTASWNAYSLELPFPCCCRRRWWGLAGSLSLTGSHCFLLVWTSVLVRFPLSWLLYLAQP